MRTIMLQLEGSLLLTAMQTLLRKFCHVYTLFLQSYLHKPLNF